MKATASSGLEGIVAAQTRLSHVDGRKGELIIAGFPVEELASRATFEEAVYLLWYDTLPTAEQLAQFRHALGAERSLHPAILELLRHAASEKVSPTDALRMAAGFLSFHTTGNSLHEDALSVVGRFPTIVAAYQRLLRGEEPVPPDPSLSHAANYLYMLTGQTPTPEAVRGMETYLSTVIDHGLNASTFTARVIISTHSDLVSAVTGAIGALKGPLHGGAPGPVLDMLLEIGEPSRALSYLRDKLEQGDRLMGFGHRIYKVRDPRADVLAAAVERLVRTEGPGDLYALARYVENIAVKLLDEYKPGRNLQTNVEFYTALLLHGLGLPAELFTPTFAVSRVAGWAAHCMEQDRLIRPQSEYVGILDRQWIPIEER